MMKSAIILVLLVAAIGLVTARPELDVLRAVETIEEQVASKPACCNQCGACDRRPVEFARCQCLDLVYQCHPSCRRCVQAPPRILPPLYRCLDMAYNDCHRNCNRATTASEVIN